MAINILGSNREPLYRVAEQELDNMRRAHVLVTDPRRTRPRWFDGRFLAARDLANEQNYFLIRQADLGRAGGTGVVEGLMITEVLDPKTKAMQLRIEAGYGFTDTGEMVVLPEKLDIDPVNIPEMQRLDAAFGLQQIPNEPGRSRTGLYIIALRPVEWTANQISAYPTSLTGERTVQDGYIIEGVVVSLVPYADNGSDDWEMRRARVARDIFLNGRDRGLSSGALPLAMVALRSNQVVWLDPYLARRDAGAERPAGMDFGFGQRALREAQLLQYDNHLVDIMNMLNGRSFEATAWFETLPPVGRLPAQAVDGDFLTHQYFPPSMTVEFAFVPEDEIPAIIEESLLLPPLDLQADSEVLTGLGVLILAPLKREEFAKYYDKLGEPLNKRNARRNPFVQFNSWFKEAVQSEVIEPNAMILATASSRFIPSVRTVLLKQFDETGFVFFTNYQSHKAMDLNANPNAEILFFWPQLQRQIRINGFVEKVSEQESDEYFASRPIKSKCAAWASPQSQVIDSRLSLESKMRDCKSGFAGVIPRPPHWGGYRLIPLIFEFWQGRPDRLHDRIRYRKEKDIWHIERLAP